MYAGNDEKHVCIYVYMKLYACRHIHIHVHIIKLTGDFCGRPACRGGMGGALGVVGGGVVGDLSGSMYSPSSFDIWSEVANLYIGRMEIHVSLWNRSVRAESVISIVIV